jgi:hypothetical protein
MRKMIILLCLSISPFAFVYPQTAVELDCGSNFKNIFKVLRLKEKYEIVQYIYKYKNGGHFSKNDVFLNNFFQLIKGSWYFEEQQDSTSPSKPGELVKAEWMSKEEMNRYLEQLNYTPEEAYKDYKDFIRIIKLEKDIYLNCIDTELSKGDSSKYSKERLSYDFIDPWSSFIPPGITKLDFLKVFKEFILNDDLETLPVYWRVKAYLKCGCKI